MTKRKSSFLFLFIFGLTLLFSKTCSAGILDKWDDPRAYKPKPVLFLHGISSSSAVWETTISKLSGLFSQYQLVGAFLETIDFPDKSGSIDTCPNGKDGWADNLKKKIGELLSNNKYGSYTNKLNLVSYSMGGLSAREFLTNPKYPSKTTDKLILIGVPNLGSPVAATNKNIITTYKFGSIINPQFVIISFAFRNNIDSFVKVFWSPGIELSEGIRDMLPKSDFLKTLNNRSRPSDTQYYGIYGIIGHLLNVFYFRNYYGGDGVISRNSQLGIDRITFAQDPIKITAFHTNEVALSTAGDNPILKFLDSTVPEFKITSAVTSNEISGNYLQIKGTVNKDYLPASSQLTINITKKGDVSASGNTPTSFACSGSLRPSDLWIPKAQDSPVAEFDEKIELSEPGIYEITLKIINPAGISSSPQIIQIEITENKPVISNVLPVGTTTQLQPEITARIYSSKKINIDLSSISLTLDGDSVKPLINPVSGGSDITISYTPDSNLDLGSHTIIINAKDIKEISAEEKISFFEIIPKEDPTITTLLIYPSYRDYLNKFGITYKKAQEAAAKNPSGSGEVVGQLCSLLSPQFYNIYRSYCCFDTSSLAGLKITSVNLCFYINYDSAFKYSQPNWGSDFELEAYLSDWGTTLGPEDWDAKTIFLNKVLIQKPLGPDPRILLSLPLSNINLAGKTSLQLVSSRDLADTEPTAGEAVVLTKAVLEVKYKKN